MTADPTAAPAADWRLIVDLDRLPPEGAVYRLRAGEAARAALADRLDIPEVRSVEGEFRLSPVEGAVRLEGTLAARLERLCVATLEPMDEVVDEPFEIVFSRERREDEGSGAADELTLEDLAIEPAPEGPLDLAEVLTQQLSLAMAAHPRREDAPPLAPEYATGGEISPFAVLKDALKQS